MIHNHLNIYQQSKRAIYHELGHWLMGRHVGFDVGNIIIGDSNSMVFGSSDIKPIPKTKLESADAIYNHLFDRVRILCAGVIADILWHETYDPKISNENDAGYFFDNGIMDKTGITDKGKITELLFVMNGIRNAPTQDFTMLEAQLEEIQRNAWDSAREFLNDNVDLVQMGSELMNQFDTYKRKTFEKEYLIQLQENVT